jgi:hypothetical protein
MAEPWGGSHMVCEISLLLLTGDLKVSFTNKKMVMTEPWQPKQLLNGSIPTSKPKLQTFECGESSNNQKINFVAQKLHVSLTLNAFRC